MSATARLSQADGPEEVNAPNESENVVPADATPARSRDFRFAVPVRSLREALPGLRDVAPRKPSLPILGHVLIERDHDVTQLSATDLDRRLTFTLPSAFPAPTSDLGKKLAAQRAAREDGNLTVNLADLAAVVKAADPATDVVFTVKSVDYTINGAHATATADILPAEEFPSSRSDWQPASIVPEPMKHGIIAALPCASTDESRHVLNGVCLEIEKNRIVATDGRNAVVFATPLPSIAWPEGTDPASIIIPSGAVKVLARFPKETASTWTIQLAKKPYAARFVAGPWTLDTAMIEGNFANIDNVLKDVPKPDKTNTFYLGIAARAQALEILKRLPKAPKADTVRCDLSERQSGSDLKFSVGAAAVAVPIQTKLKPRYATALRVFWQRLLSLGCTEIQFIDEMSPIVGRGRHAGGAQMLYIFMPFRSEAK